MKNFDSTRHFFILSLQCKSMKSPFLLLLAIALLWYAFLFEGFDAFVGDSAVVNTFFVEDTLQGEVIISVLDTPYYYKVYDYPMALRGVNNNLHYLNTSRETIDSLGLSIYFDNVMGSHYYKAELIYKAIQYQQVGDTIPVEYVQSSRNKQYYFKSINGQDDIFRESRLFLWAEVVLYFVLLLWPLLLLWAARKKKD